jgi:hypothetical protein
MKPVDLLVQDVGRLLFWLRAERLLDKVLENKDACDAYTDVITNPLYMARVEAKKAA